MSIIRSSITCFLQQICLGDEIEKNDIGRTCREHGEIRNQYKILVGDPERKRPLLRPRRRREDNIKKHLNEMGLECVDWIHLRQGPIAGPRENGNRPSGFVTASAYWTVFCGVSWLHRQ
jgi:hypothetical protein